MKNPGFFVIVFASFVVRSHSLPGQNYRISLPPGNTFLGRYILCFYSCLSVHRRVGGHQMHHEIGIWKNNSPRKGQVGYPGAVIRGPPC